MSYASRLCEMKDLNKIHIRGNFHQYSICGCAVKNVQSFMYRLSIHEMTPFWALWALTPPNIVQSCWNFDQRLSPRRQKLFEKPFKILHFGSNGTRPTFMVLVHFGAQFITGKPKILLKTKISAKTTSWGISNSISPRSQKNHRILVKLSQKNFWGTQNGFKLPLGLQ